MISAGNEFLRIIAALHRLLLVLHDDPRRAETAAEGLAAPAAARFIQARKPHQVIIWLARLLFTPENSLAPASAQDLPADSPTAAPPPPDGLTPQQALATLRAAPPALRPWAALRFAAGLDPKQAAEALRLSRHSAAALERQARQLPASDQLSPALSSLEPSPALASFALAALEQAEKQHQSAAARVFRPAWIAAVCSLLIALALIGAQIWERATRFPGSEKAERLLAKAGPAPGKRFDDIAPGPHGVSDWLYLAKPAGLPGAPQNRLREIALDIAKARLFDSEGLPVVECLGAGGDAAVMLFSASEAGVTLEQEGRWYPVRSGERQGLISRSGDACLLVAALRGSPAAYIRKQTTQPEDTPPAAPLTPPHAAPGQ